MFAIDDQPEVFFSSAATSSAASYAVQNGRARRIARGIYTTNMVDPLEVVTRRHWERIAARVFTDAVIVDRTAIELKPAEDGSVTLAAARPREVTMPGLRLRARAGTGPQDDDTRWMGEQLYMSSRPRAFLENCRPSRARKGLPRTLSQAELEVALDVLASRDAERLNVLRDRARELAPLLDARGEFETLDALIGALHGIRSMRLATSRGRARASGAPYDEGRIVRFEQLQHHLLQVAAPQRPESPRNELTTFAFFEAYFSNFIEGTEFTLAEAERIVFEGAIPQQRPQDAHDILGTYELVAAPAQRGRVPGSADDLIEQLQDQHRVMLSARPNVGPGRFKTEANRAGATHFVAPEFVEGTLRESWRFYDSLPRGFARAAFALFAVSEVHPFADGNGRIARVLMNAELSAAGEQRIIVPTSLRGDYLSGLRAMTHNALADTYVRVVSSLQAFTSGVDFSSRQAAELELLRRRAFDDPSEQPGVLDQVLGQAQPRAT